MTMNLLVLDVGDPRRGRSATRSGGACPAVAQLTDELSHAWHLLAGPAGPAQALGADHPRRDLRPYRFSGLGMSAAFFHRLASAIHRLSLGAACLLGRCCCKSIMCWCPTSARFALL